MKNKHADKELNEVMRAVQYVLAHKYGQKDPVGTRVIAIDGLRIAYESWLRAQNTDVAFGEYCKINP